MKAKYIAFALIMFAVVALVAVFVWKGSAWNPISTTPQPGLGPVGIPNVPTGIDTYNG